MHPLQAQYKTAIEELSAACRRVAELGYVSSHGGNLSYRVAPDVVLITPTKVPKRNIGFEDVCIVDMSSNVLFASPGRKPTGEIPFHIHIYQMRPDVNAIVHAHPPILTGFAISGSRALERPFLPEPVLEVGPMLTVPYAEPLSDALAHSFDARLQDANGFLMKNHGALMCSTEGIERALDFLEMMEAAAKSLLVANLLGGADELPKSDVDDMERTLRTRNMKRPCAPTRPGGLADLFF